MVRSIPGFLALMISLQCFADLRVSSPGQSCRLLTDVHLRAGDWVRSVEGLEGCRSSARTISLDNPNLILFFVEGRDSIPLKLNVLVDVSAVDDGDPAKRELVKVTKRLAVRALGLSIPYLVEESIMKGTPFSLSLGVGKLTFTRTPIVKGRYQMAVAAE